MPQGAAPPMNDLMQTCADGGAALRCLLPSVSRSFVDDGPSWDGGGAARVKEEPTTPDWCERSRWGVTSEACDDDGGRVKAELDFGGDDVAPIRWVVENGVVKVESRSSDALNAQSRFSDALNAKSRSSDAVKLESRSAVAVFVKREPEGECPGISRLLSRGPTSEMISLGGPQL